MYLLFNLSVENDIENCNLMKISKRMSFYIENGYKNKYSSYYTSHNLLLEIYFNRQISKDTFMN